MLEFELKPLSKYITECPRCSDSRDKKNTKTLCVYRDPPNEKGICYIRWQCTHSGQCEWNERQYTIDDRTEAFTDNMDSTIKTTLSFTGELPKTWKDNQLWWYHDSDGSLLFGVVRINKPDGKVYNPVTISHDGVVSVLAHWPSSSTNIFYQQHLIADAKKILVVEGEKTADAAQALFPNTTVITWPKGSGNVLSAPWGLLSEKEVYIWPDNDSAGFKAADLAISKIENSIIHLVDVSSFPKGSDLADNLTMKDIQKALKDAKVIDKRAETVFSTTDSVIKSAFSRPGRYMTGWDEVDDKVQFPMSGVVVVEGRTGHGKTAFASNLAYNALHQGKEVYYFSFEVPEDEIIARLVRIKTPTVEISEVLRNFREKAEDELKWISSGALHITDPSKRLSSGTLQKMLNDAKFNGSLVIIDYAQKIPTNKIDIRQGLVDLMDSMELLSKEHGFLILMLCQLTPYYPDPLLDAPAESKSIHYNADMVLRVWKKHDQWTHPIYDEVPGNYVVDVRKNRNGQSDQLLGFLFEAGASLTPNDSNVKTFKPRANKDRSADALEKIAAHLEYMFAKDKF